MININNNNKNNNKNAQTVSVNVSSILYSEVAPIAGDVISPSLRDAEKILLIKAFTERSLL